MTKPRMSARPSCQPPVMTRATRLKDRPLQSSNPSLMGKANRKANIKLDNGPAAATNPIPVCP